MNPSQHEGALHATRQHIISNRSLMQSADRTGLPQFIHGKPFSYKMWHPPNFTIDPLASLGTVEHGTVGNESNVVTGYDHTHCSLPGAAFEPQNSATSSNQRLTRKRSHDDSVIQWLGDKVPLSATLRTNIDYFSS